MSAETALWLTITAAGEWATIDAAGVEKRGKDALECVSESYVEPRDVFVATGAELVTLLSAIPAKGRPDNTLIRERDGQGADCAGFSYVHGASFWLGAMGFPEPVGDYCKAAGWPKPSGSPQDSVRKWREAWCTQHALTERLAGVAPTHSLSGTAAKAAVPKDWRRGADHFSKSIAMADIRQSCAGGRIECYRPGWEGDAVEFDIRSAYGWALMQPLPDWQVYQRRAYAGEARWLDCTVELSGAVGPLPVRDPGDTHALTWPNSGRHRGWWTSVDLDKSGVRIVEVHGRYAGRLSLDLRPHVGRWLEEREKSSDYATKATIRAMAVGLAGKLWQRPESWGLWHVEEGPAPYGSTQLGQTDWLVYPCKSNRAVLSLPTTASHVTALVRQKVWPHIADGCAIYTHTDSVHIAADDVLAGCGPETGDKAGDWSIKAEGQASYRGVNHYSIGKKVVRPSLTSSR